MKQRKYFSVREKSGHSQSQVGSFREVLEEVHRQIEIECFTAEELPQVKEIALIIAEVMKLNPQSEIQIAKDKLPAEMVQEIYLRIQKEHVETVIRHYRAATYEIKHTKSYLRTALYNCVFELESRVGNEVKKDMPWLYSESNN